MGLDIGEALRDGARRTVAPSGLLLAGLFVLVGAANSVALQSFYAEYLAFAVDQGAEIPGGVPELPLALPIPIVASAAWVLAMLLVGEAARVVAVRTMAGDNAAGLPPGVGRNFAYVLANAVVAGLIVYLLSALGTLLLVVPGVFLAVALFFVRQAVALDDATFVDALGDSWALTAGSRVEVFVLAAVLVGLRVAAALPGLGVSAALAGDSLVPAAVNVVLRGPVVVFAVAATTRAYVQLRDGEPAAVAEPADEGEGDEWDDPPGVDI